MGAVLGVYASTMVRAHLRTTYTQNLEAVDVDGISGPTPFWIS